MPAHRVAKLVVERVDWQIALDEHLSRDGIEQVLKSADIRKAGPRLLVPRKAAANRSGSKRLAMTATGQNP